MAIVCQPSLPKLGDQKACETAPPLRSAEKAQVIKTERDVETSAPHRELSGGRDALVLVLEAQKAANQGEVKQALLLYRQAIEQAPPDLSGEIEERIAELEDRLPKTKTAPPRQKQNIPPDRVSFVESTSQLGKKFVPIVRAFQGRPKFKLPSPKLATIGRKLREQRVYC